MGVGKLPEMARSKLDEKPALSLPQRVIGVLAGLFFGGFGLVMFIHEGVAALTGVPGTHWPNALCGLLMLVILLLVLSAKAKYARRRQRFWGLLICLFVTGMAAMSDYVLIAPETQLTSSVEVIGFGRSSTTDVAGKSSSHGVTVYLYAIATNSLALAMWYAWLRRLPGWFGERR